jgi:diguanylate cyclase (GGDEF)-like protein
VARLGGDEFGIVLSEVEDRPSAVLAGERISVRADRPFRFAGEPLQMGASIGVSIFPDDGEQPDDLVEKADQAMYVVKRERKRTRQAPPRDSAESDTPVLATNA